MARPTRDPRELGGVWRQHQRHSFAPPIGELTPWVERFWTVEWDYATPYRQKVLPYPNVHVTFRGTRPPEVHGVSTRHVVRDLDGRGRVVGVAFRPGVFRQILGQAVATITDHIVAAAGMTVLQPVPTIEDAGDLERWLLAVLPPPDPRGREVSEMVDHIRLDGTLNRVDELAATVGSSVRRLQRLFAEHVGVSPKWVIRRYRLHEVTERMAVGSPIDWAGLAAELGYADQAHLTRDFTDLFGESPTAYVRRYP